jgi:sulfatase maturation enzyme AslB (radical SAM superfamily)
VLRSISLKRTRAKKLEELKATTNHSLVAESIKHVEGDEEHIMTAEALRKLGQERLTKEERIKRRRALDTLGVPSFDEFLAQKKLSLHKGKIEILQMNIGLYCNQACNHCHVESSPKRSEMMTEDIARRCMHLMEKTPSVKTLDITGGAPELNSQFRYLVSEGRRQGKEVIDRCNLTVLSEPGQEDLAQFLADNQVRVVASLPCYSEKNVNTQRGSGVFDKSILGLLKLNQLGYSALSRGGVCAGARTCSCVCVRRGGRVCLLAPVRPAGVLLFWLLNCLVRRARQSTKSRPTPQSANAQTCEQVRRGRKRSPP